MKIRICILIFLFFIFGDEFLFAQITQASLTVGGTGDDRGYGLVQTTDGGYAVAGYTGSYGAGNFDVYVVKFDNAGALQWTKTIGGTADDRGYFGLIQTNDGGYALAGSTMSYGSGNYDVYVVKLNSTGSVQWTKAIGGALEDQGSAIVQTTDGGYAVTGHTYSYGAGGGDVYVLKLDNSGSVQWTKTIGGPNLDYARSIVQSTDGGYVVAGSTISYGAGNYDDYVIKLDNTGVVQWTKIIGTVGDEHAWSIVKANGGGYVVAGHVQNGSDFDNYVVKLDNAGTVQWTKTIGGTNIDYARNIIQDVDGSFAMAGYTNSYGAGNYDFYIVKLTSAGALQWTKTVGGTGADLAYSIIQTTDGSYAAAGITNSYGSGNYDVCMVKLDNAVSTCISTGSGGVLATPTVSVISNGSVSSGSSVSSGGSVGSGGVLATQCLVIGSLNVSVTATNLNCNNQCTGTGTATASNGTSPYTYSWSPSGGTSSAATGLCAGNYTVTVTDASSATKTASVTVTQPPALTATATAVSPACSGNNGSATVTAGGGSPGYSYSWNPSGQTSQSATGLAAGTYTVSISDSQGCPVTQTVVIASGSVTATASGSTICAGQTATLTASGGTSYSWSTGSTSTSISVSPTVNTGYSVTVSNGSCSSTAVASVVVNAIPVVSISGTTSVCSGQSTTLTASGGGTYLWNPGGATTTSISVNPTMVTTYSVTATTNGCSGTKSQTVTITPAPTANAGPDISVCSGDSVVLNGTGNGTFSWAPSSGLSCTTCANPVATPTAVTTYTLTVTNSCGSATDAATITYPAVPSANAGPSATICEGSSTTLSGTGSGTFIWSPSTGLSCTTCANPVATPSITTTYTFSITASCGTNSDTVTITVNSLPTVSITGSNTICPGANATLTASGGTNYSWSTGASTSMIIVSPTTATNYTVTVSSAGGCSKDTSVTVSLNQLPTANAGPNVSMCAGSSTTFSATGNGTYTWSPGTGLSCTACANPVCTATANITYTLSVVNACGTAVDSILVTTPALPSANAGPPVTICAGNTTTLSGSGSGSFLWSPAAGLSCTNCPTPVATPTGTTTYTLSITAPCGTNTSTVTVTVNPLPVINAGPDISICAGTNTTLNSIGLGTFSWSPGTGLSCTTCANPIAAPTVTTSYTVTASNSCGSKSDSVTVTIATTPSINAGPDVTICPGGNASLLANGSGTYSWAPPIGLSCTSCPNPVASPGVSTDYTVTITSSCGTASDSVWVVTNSQFVVISGATTVCSGSSATLSTASGGTYVWNTGATSSSIVVAPSSSTVYSVTVTNSSGCSASASATVSVSSAPVASVSSTTICAGDTATLNAAGGGNYLWSTGETTTSISVSPTSSNTYSVIVSGGNCVSTASGMVTVNAIPTAVALSSVTISQGQSTNLTALGGGTYQWNPATGLSCTTCPNPVATPTVTTNYCVLVMDGNGCTDSACLTITLGDSCGAIYIPNAFSPNNDMENDFECVMGTCIESMHLVIYNRWGEMVFESSSQKICWDGMYSGKFLDTAVFNYYLEATFTNGEKIRKKGNISLIQ